VGKRSLWAVEVGCQKLPKADSQHNRFRKTFPEVQSFREGVEQSIQKLAFAQTKPLRYIAVCNTQPAYLIAQLLPTPCLLHHFISLPIKSNHLC
jgi:hypothetical protein